jgi:hypothetical protein
VAIRHRDQSVGRGQVIGEAAPTENHLAADRLGRSSLKGGPPFGGGQVAAGPGRRQGSRLENGAPARTAAQMSEQAPLGRPRRQRATGSEGLQPHDDAGRAEAALAGPRFDKGVRPSLPLLGWKTVKGRHRSASDPSGRRDARDPGLTVDQQRAAPALALGAAAVLDRAKAEAITQYLKQRRPVVGNDDGTSIYFKFQ